MQAHHGRISIRPVVAAVVLAIVLLVVWSHAPEAIQVPLFLLILCAEAIGYAALYLIQRRRHW